MRFAKVLLTAFLVALLLASCGNNAPKAPNATTRLSAYVGPSIAYISTTYEGTVITDAGLYLGEEDKEAEVFTVTSACTGFAVGDEGHIATAGHCVDPKEAEQGIVDASVEWGVDLPKGKATAEDFRAEGLNVETADPDSRKEGADRVSVTVAFGADEDQQHKARVLKFRTASRGDTAILKIENDGCQPRSQIAVPSMLALRWCRSDTRQGRPCSRRGFRSLFQGWRSEFEEDARRRFVLRIRGVVCPFTWNERRSDRHVGWQDRWLQQFGRRGR